MTMNMAELHGYYESLPDQRLQTIVGAGGPESAVALMIMRDRKATRDAASVQNVPSTTVAQDITAPQDAGLGGVVQMANGRFPIGRVPPRHANPYINMPRQFLVRGPMQLDPGMQDPATPYTSLDRMHFMRRLQEARTPPPLNRPGPASSAYASELGSVPVDRMGQIAANRRLDVSARDGRGYGSIDGEQPPTTPVPGAGLPYPSELGSVPAGYEEMIARQNDMARADIAEGDYGTTADPLDVARIREWEKARSEGPYTPPSSTAGYADARIRAGRYGSIDGEQPQTTPVPGAGLPYPPELGVQGGIPAALPNERRARNIAISQGVLPSKAQAANHWSGIDKLKALGNRLINPQEYSPLLNKGAIEPAVEKASAAIKSGAQSVGNVVSDIGRGWAKYPAEVAASFNLPNQLTNSDKGRNLNYPGELSARSPLKQGASPAVKIQSQPQTNETQGTPPTKEEQQLAEDQAALLEEGQPDAGEADGESRADLVARLQRQFASGSSEDQRTNYFENIEKKLAALQDGKDGDAAGMALLRAGLGIAQAGGKGASLAAAVGEGGLAGLDSYDKQRAASKKDALKMLGIEAEIAGARSGEDLAHRKIGLQQMEIELDADRATRQLIQKGKELGINERLVNAKIRDLNKPDTYKWYMSLSEEQRAIVNPILRKSTPSLADEIGKGALKLIDNLEWRGDFEREFEAKNKRKPTMDDILAAARSYSNEIFTGARGAPPDPAAIMSKGK